ncbi:hypothetical protein ACQJBY_062786 [Aegilops geniculata]
MDNDAYYYLLVALFPLVYLMMIYRGSLTSSNGALRLPPGPWQLPVIGSLHHLLGALPHRALRDLSRRHGPLMLLRFGEVPVIVASTAEASKEITKMYDHIFCTRPLSASAKVLSERGKGIAFAPYGGEWRQLRKICILELLGARNITSFRPIREEEVTRLIRSIVDDSSESSEVVNLSKMLATYVTHATVHCIMGGRFKEHDTLLHYVDEAVEVVGGFTLPDLFPSSRLVRALSGTLRRAEVFRDSVLAFIGRVIDEHLDRRSSEEAEAHQEQDIIDVLLRIQRDGNLQFPLTVDNLKVVIFDLFAAGSEAPATILQWAMAELMRKPSTMAKAQAEVRGAFMGQTKVTEEGLGELSYLHCIIKETLRLHPPGPFLLPKQCQEQCKILGYDVPKGTTVLLNAWAISRDPEYWDEPDAFVPDRFLASATDYKGNCFEFIPFGAGRRICPGMLFGVAIAELALASLLFHFDWTLPDGTSPGDIDMTETMGITARKKEDLQLRATLHLQPAET